MAAEKTAHTFLRCAYRIDPSSSTLVSPSINLFDLEDVDAPISLPEFVNNLEITENSMDRSTKVSASFSLEGSYLAFSGAAEASLEMHSASTEKTIRADHTLYAVKYKALSNVLDYGEVLRADVIKFVRDNTVEKIEKALGHFYATEVTLGGTLHLTRIIKATSSDTASSLRTSIEASYGTALSGSIKANASAGSDHKSSATGREETSYVRAQGGNVSKWLAYDGSLESKAQCQKAWAEDMKDSDLFPLNMKLVPIWEAFAEHAELKEKAGELETYLLAKWKTEDEILAGESKGAGSFSKKCLVLKDGRELYCNSPGSGSRASTESRGSHSNTSSERRLWNYDDSTGYVTMDDTGRQLYVNPGSWAYAERPGTHTNKDDKRRKWTYDATTGILKLRHDGRELYSSKKSSWATAEPRGEATNTQDSRRMFFLK